MCFIDDKSLLIAFEFLCSLRELGFIRALAKYQASESLFIRPILPFIKCPCAKTVPALEEITNFERSLLANNFLRRDPSAVLHDSGNSYDLYRKNLCPYQKLDE